MIRTVPNYVMWKLKWADGCCGGYIRLVVRLRRYISAHHSIYPTYREVMWRKDNANMRRIQMLQIRIKALIN